MGSPVGPTFAEFYMSHIENAIFNNHITKPTYVHKMCWRHLYNNTRKKTKKQKHDTINKPFEENSILKFAFELHINNKIPFLVVLIEYNNKDIFDTSI